MEVVPIVPTESGNTITDSGERKVKQISPSKKWCFTLNNYKSEDIDEIIKTCSNSSIKYMFQEETGENGTKHLQGFLIFQTKKRPFNAFSNNKIHWEKMRGSIDDNINYCSKTDTRTGNLYQNIKETIKTITELKEWQFFLKEKLLKEPDERTINWYWENQGNVGKSAFVKYMCVHHNAYILGSKASDMKFALASMIKNNKIPPKIIFIDVPRESMDYLSYAGIEEIKNGCFFSGKFESEMVLMNSPHIVIFANERPDERKMSKDRWNVVRIKG